MIALLLAAVAGAAHPVVVTDAGRLRGMRGDDGRAIFHAVPFAKPPIGDLRFRAPQRPVHWRSERDATKTAPACPQIDYGWNHDAAANQSEDCLYLEVATPDLHPRKRLPVMVWIHGGGNRAGGGAGLVLSPIVAQGIVLVSIQYRLSALGFLSHPALSAEDLHHRSGNYALMDQQAALRWVKRNIAAFGGDARNVTVFGESAGAQDVGLQQLSPGARELFAKAIEESGSAGFGTPPRSLAENERVGELIVAQTGLSADTTAAQLRALPAAALIRAAEHTDVPGLDDDSFIWLQAVVDGGVITRPPADTLERGTGAKVPLIIGTNARELPLYGGDAGTSRAILQAFGARAADALRVYGVGQGRTPVSDTRRGDVGAQLATDINFRCPSDYVSSRHAATGASTWQYQFDVDGHDGAAVHHASEIAKVLGPADPRAPLAAYWVAFAKTGNPNTAGLPLWPRFRLPTRSYMAFGNSGPRPKRALRSIPCVWLQRP